jgi:hypothetical protein
MQPLLAVQLHPFAMCESSGALEAIELTVRKIPQRVHPFPEFPSYQSP